MTPSPATALLPACAAAVAAGVAWQVADVRRLHAQVDAARQDLEALRHAPPGTDAERLQRARDAVARYAAEITHQYNRRLRQIPVRWLAPLWRWRPHPETPPAAAAGPSVGPWG